MNLQTLRKSISQMNDDESLALVMSIRNSRHIQKAEPKKTRKGTKTTKKTSTKSLVAGLKDHERKALLKEFLES